jgi:GT2 family glycosyltransferase
MNNISPKVTIITSFFKADKYIDHYLNHIKNIFGYRKLCIHHIYNILGSHQNNELVNQKLQKFADEYPNFELKSIKKDPGLYGLWNISVKTATTPYIMTLNIDDMCEPEYVVRGLREIEKEWVDVVSCPIKVTKKINASFDDYHVVWYKKKKFYYDTRYNIQEQRKIANIIITLDGKYYETKCNRVYKIHAKKIPTKYKRSLMVYYKTYCLEDMFTDWKCDDNYMSFNMPHCSPIWKRELHHKYGYFNEDKYGVYADFEFWMRLLKNGKRFIQMDKPMVLYLEDDNSHNRRDGKRDEFMVRLKREYL